MDASTLFVSWVSSGIFNLDSKRFRRASLDTRSEGWTETWGGKAQGLSDAESTTSDDNCKPEDQGKFDIDDEFISQLFSTPYPQTEIVLAQYRPAWLEQMFMRVAEIPHIVLNSNNICNEATGQLPYLRDCAPSKPPVLVGRNQPTNLKEYDIVINNSILSYLQRHRNADLDEKAGFTTDQQRGLSRCFQHMINSELSTILSYLRYEDSDVWDRVYRKQYVQASTIEGNRNGEPGYWFTQLRGKFQAMMERNTQRRRLLGIGANDKKRSTEQLLEHANECYFAIDRQLLCITKEQDETISKNYLLGTEMPALVDVLLWAHLAEALCDVHLVVLLASYPRLVKYFQDMYQTYFSSGEGTSNAGSSWREWNEQQNLSNDFQQIPTLSEEDINHCSAIKDTVDLMQKSSLQKRNLQEVLQTVRHIRVQENHPKSREPKSFLLYRWCMGETTRANSLSEEKTQENPIRKKLLRDQARNDQMWISGIFGISAVALILIRGGV